MTVAKQTQITRLLNSMVRGEPKARTRLWELVYDDLAAIARSRLARLDAGLLLEVTDLVHEVYLKLMSAEAPWESRRHFYGVASLAMRDLLVDESRKEGRLKRGGGLQRITFHEGRVGENAKPVDWLALGEALDRLKETSPEQHEIVLLRYFCGLSVDEVARTLGISPSSVDREWRFARAWLLRCLSAS